MIYFPMSQHLRILHSLEVRTTLPPAVLAPAVRQALADVNPNFMIREVRTLEAQVDRTLVYERMLAKLLGCFSLLALLLSCIGLYGILSYAVTRRTPEIGVRMALGARPEQMLRLVLGDTLRLVLVGLTIGLAGALASTRLLARFLFGLAPGDPMTLALAASLLLAVAVLASYLPARRAARVDPMTALRYE